jgi:hypothetical protein
MYSFQISFILFFKHLYRRWICDYCITLRIQISCILQEGVAACTDSFDSCKSLKEACGGSHIWQCTLTHFLVCSLPFTDLSYKLPSLAITGFLLIVVVGMN